MDFAYLRDLRRENCSWRLLASDNAPLVLSFLYDAFVKRNVRSIIRPELLDRLDRRLSQLHEQDINVAKRSAAQYLEEWSEPKFGYLRMYYAKDSDEPFYDITSAVEKAILWVQGLSKRAFVGTESKLIMVFEMLNDLILMSSQDPKLRIRELESQKLHIESEIDALKSGHIKQYDATQVKERYFHIEDALRALLADFRQVEENFRKLDRATRATITTKNLNKGLVLDQIFAESDNIETSDEGKSFASFWGFLMSESRQLVLEERLTQLFEIKELTGLREDSQLSQMKYQLIDAGAHIKEVLNGLSAELRRFLSSQSLHSSKRVLGLSAEIKKLACDLQDEDLEVVPPDLAGDRVTIFSSMGRALFNPDLKLDIQGNSIEQGDSASADGLDTLLEQRYVDTERLRGQINICLNGRLQVSLGEVVERFPVQDGVAEVVHYLNIANDASGVLWNNCEELIELDPGNKRGRRARLTQVIFTELV